MIIIFLYYTGIKGTKENLEKARARWNNFPVELIYKMTHEEIIEFIAEVEVAKSYGEISEDKCRQIRNVLNSRINSDVKEIETWGKKLMK